MPKNPSNQPTPYHPNHQPHYHPKNTQKLKLKTEQSYQYHKQEYNPILTPTHRNKEITNSRTNKQNYQSLKNKLGCLQNKLAEIRDSIENQRFGRKRGEDCKERNQKDVKFQKKQKGQERNKENHISPTRALKIKISGNQNNQSKNQVISNKYNSDNYMKKSKLLAHQSPKNKNSKIQISAYVTQVPQNQAQFVIEDQNTMKLEARKNIKKYMHDYCYYFTPLFWSMINYPQGSSSHRQHFYSSYQFFKYWQSTNSSLHTIQTPIKIPLPPLKATRKHPNITKTIIFDLDETLIHCLEMLDPYDSPSSNQQKLRKADKCIQIKQIGAILINIRPYLYEVLEELSNYFQLMLFTASHSSYAQGILEYIDPYNQYFSYKFCRQCCIKTRQGFYIKDLRVIDRNIENILLVDNAAYSYSLQPANGIPIIPFYSDKSDTELLKLKQYLMNLIPEKNLQQKNQYIMKNQQYGNYDSPMALLNSFLE